MLLDFIFLLILVEFHNKNLMSYPVEIYLLSRWSVLQRTLLALCFLAVEDPSLENFLLQKIFEVPRTIA